LIRAGSQAALYFFEGTIYDLNIGKAKIHAQAHNAEGHNIPGRWISVQVIFVMWSVFNLNPKGAWR